MAVVAITYKFFQDHISEILEPTKLLPKINSSELSINIIDCHRFSFAKRKYVLDRDGMIALCYTMNGVKCGFQYWDIYYKVPHFICHGYQYNSQDGEYRNYFVEYERFNTEYDTNATHLEPFELAIIDVIQSKTVDFSFKVYGKNLANISVLEVEQYAKDSRDGIRMLAMTALTNMYQIFNERIEWHSGDGIFDLMRTIDKTHPKLKELSVTWLKNNQDHIIAGQKLVPIPYRATFQPGYVDFKLWKEIYVNTKINDLIANCCCAGFPVYGGATFIYGDATLFENKNMQKLYNPVLPTEYEQLDEDVKEMLMETMTMSQYVAVISFSFSGYTLDAQSLLLSVAPNKKYDPEYFDTLEKHEAHIFQIFYSLHCMHEQLGIIHADLHANNITFCCFRNSGDCIFLIQERPDYHFILPLQNYRPIIIDFSRAIVDDEHHRIQLIEQSGKAQICTFYENQIKSIIELIDKYCPLTTTDKEKLEIALNTNFDAVFSLVKMVDFLSVIKVYPKAILKPGGDPKYISPILFRKRNFLDCTEWAAKIEKWIMTCFKESLQALLEMPADGVTITAPILPRLAANFYSQYKLPVDSTAKTSGIWKAYGELKYHTNEYALFPPFAQLSELQHLAKALNKSFSNADYNFLEQISKSDDFHLLEESKK